VADKSLMDPAAPRSGLVEVTLRDGRKLTHFTRHAPGTKENPIATEAINEKVRDLMAPVIGAQRTEEAIRRVHAIEQMANVRDFVRSVLGQG